MSPDNQNYNECSPEEGEKVVPIKYQSVSLGEIGDREAQDWIIYDLLPKAALGVIYGESGSGKTFTGLAMAMAIARGTPWGEEAPDPDRILYVCAESIGGFRNRVHAYATRHNLDLHDITNFRVIDGAPNLLDDRDFKFLEASLLHHGRCQVIIIDTFARVTSGANENAGEQMSKAIERCTRIHELTGALVILIHHSGKDAAKGARGWSGIRAALDVEIEITKQGNAHKAEVTKQKDGKEISWWFNLFPIVIGKDKKGRDITSCYYEETIPEPQTTKLKIPHGTWQKLVMKVFSRLTHGESNGFINEDILIENVVKNSVKVATEVDSKRDTRKQQSVRAINELIVAELLQKTGENIHLFK